MIQPSEDLERWRSLALDAITGGARPMEARRRFARWAAQLLERAGQQGPPVDLYAIAAQLQAKVEVAEISGRGMLLDMERERLIFVQKGSSPAVQRFSIAHECAHIVFRNAIQSRVRDPDLVNRVHEWGASPEQERLCDLLASELLMPERFVRQVLETSPERGLQLGRAVAGSFGVSTVAALRRLVDVGEPYLLVLWQRTLLPSGDVRYRVAWCDRPAGHGVTFISTDVSAPNDSPIRWVAQGRGTRSEWMELQHLNLGAGIYRCDLMRYGGGVLLIADLASRTDRTAG